MNHFFITTFLLLFSFICSYAQIEIPAKLTDRPEIIIKHSGYTLSYNTQHNTPNWVTWMLTKSHINGKEPRSNQFLPDHYVPLSFRVLPSDYTGGGYDRGHLYPAADASWSPTSMKESFYMSNMCPQDPALNRRYWKELESKCRTWVLTEDTLYIVCGPIYSGNSKTIGKTHKVTVPTGFFKVILSLRKGHAKAIGFLYDNTSIKQSLSSTTMSVDAIELLTGIAFFYTLEDSLENNLESTYNLKDWK